MVVRSGSVQDELVRKRRIALPRLASERGVWDLRISSAEVRDLKVIKFDTSCDCYSKLHRMRL